MWTRLSLFGGEDFISLPGPEMLEDYPNAAPLLLIVLDFCVSLLALPANYT